MIMLLLLGRYSRSVTVACDLPVIAGEPVALTCQSLYSHDCILSIVCLRYDCNNRLKCCK